MEADLPLVPRQAAIRKRARVDDAVSDQAGNFPVPGALSCPGTADAGYDPPGLGHPQFLGNPRAERSPDPLAVTQEVAPPVHPGPGVRQDERPAGVPVHDPAPDALQVGLPAVFLRDQGEGQRHVGGRFLEADLRPGQMDIQVGHVQRASARQTLRIARDLTLERGLARHARARRQDAERAQNLPQPREVRLQGDRPVGRDRLPGILGGDPDGPARLERDARPGEVQAADFDRVLR